MKVFICWSGERSKVIAESLQDWLKRVIQGLKPFLSTQEIRTGKRWFSEIAGELPDTKFGILCLTPENLESPWLHFEAGALSKTIDDKTFVCSYLISGLQPTQVPDPLGQFQSNSADKEGTHKLLRAINSALDDKKLEEVVLSETFKKFWPDLEKVLQSLPPVKGEERPKRNVEDMVEEVLDTVRGLAFTMQRREEIPSTFPEPSASSSDDIRNYPKPKERVLENLTTMLASIAKEKKKRQAERAKKEELKKKSEIPH